MESKLKKSRLGDQEIGALGGPAGTQGLLLESLLTPPQVCHSHYFDSITLRVQFDMEAEVQKNRMKINVL